MRKKINKVAIIGAGPAGIACAIQLKRSGINPLIIERGEIGGMLYNANLVENYPGFPGGITGNKLAALMKKQFLAQGLKAVKKNVINITYKNNLFIIFTGKGIYFSEQLVISCGSKPVELEEKKLTRGTKEKIHYDISKIKNVKGKDILVIGSGDLAFDYAISLGRNNKIQLINRSDKVKCIPMLFKKFKNLKNRGYYTNTVLKSVQQGRQKKLRVKCAQNGKTAEYTPDLIVAAIGRTANLDIITKIVRRNTLQINKKLFIIGDALNKNFRQAAIASGDGVKTAMTIKKIPEV